jgi:hypothetical protein
MFNTELAAVLGLLLSAFLSYTHLQVWCQWHRATPCQAGQQRNNACISQWPLPVYCAKAFMSKFE